MYGHNQVPPVDFFSVASDATGSTIRRALGVSLAAGRAGYPGQGSPHHATHSR